MDNTELSMMHTPHRGPPPTKQARGGRVSNGIKKAARPAARTRHKPATRTPKQRSNGKPKKAGRGAERLATPNPRGIYHQPLQGPSFQQSWAVEAADGQLTWVEGSVETAVVRRNDGAMQKKQRREKGKDKTPKFPEEFSPGQKLLLVATEADLARVAVQEIKCRLCPDAKFKNFDQFKHHCDTLENHPLGINFREYCGDFFARPDSLNRASQQRPTECKSISPEKATAKRRKTQRAQDAFIARLEVCLKMGEDIEKWFSQIIKEKSPWSAKKARSP